MRFSFSSRSWNTGPALYPPCRVLEGLWEFAQPVYMCFVDLEKAFDRVPHGILWGVLREYGVRGPLLRAVRSLYDRSRSLVRIAGRFLGVAKGPEGVRFGNHRISSLLFADDVVLLASSSQDLQHVLEQFAAECEAGWDENQHLQIRGHGSRPEKGGVPSPGWVERSCLKWRSSSISGSCSRSEGKMKREIDRRIGAASAVMWVGVPWTAVMGEEGAEPKGQWSIYVPTHYLWS
ncbi:hypothetical protein L3Q82_017808 [Scortum barcoo]|uniref:Uncharacterized protein n=1 Tax=Scortum barcoo TaxID=214431 RepID=A0ACB8VLR3_9TELE|nr:hypothetical protein L3Q82_017808 [Scortum barcoo]